jgi:hypothetical protein
VLIVPTINGDGRAANTRGNANGQDLNRDYSLIREPETFAFVEMMRDYDPEAAFDGHEFGNNQAGDLPVLPPRHLNVARSIFDQSKSMIEDFLYTHGSDDGWWYCPYGCQNGGAVGLSQETILRNTLGSPPSGSPASGARRLANATFGATLGAGDRARLARLELPGLTLDERDDVVQLGEEARLGVGNEGQDRLVRGRRDLVLVHDLDAAIRPDEDVDRIVVPDDPGLLERDDSAEVDVVQHRPAPDEPVVRDVRSVEPEKPVGTSARFERQSPAHDRLGLRDLAEDHRPRVRLEKNRFAGIFDDLAVESPLDLYGRLHGAQCGATARFPSRLGIAPHGLTASSVAPPKA